MFQLGTMKVIWPNRLWPNCGACVCGGGQLENSTCTFEGFRCFKHHQISTRRHPERHKESETVVGKGRKRAKFLGARSTSANFDFGQLFFSTSANFDFGQFRLWPISTSANSISANLWMLNFGTTKCGALEGWGPKGWRGPNLEKVGLRIVGPRRVEPRRVGGPKGGGPEPRKSGPRRVGPRRVGPRRVEPRRVLLLRHNFLSSFSLWESSRGILVVFEVPRHLKFARLEFSGCHVRARAARSGGAAGVSHNSPGAPTSRERKKNENCGGRRGKKERHFGGWSGGGWSGGGWSGGGWSGGGSGGGWSGGGFSQLWGPAEGSIGNGVQGSGFRVQFRFLGRKQKQNKNKMKREMSKNKKKVK